MLLLRAPLLPLLLLDAVRIVAALIIVVVIITWRASSVKGRRDDCKSHRPINQRASERALLAVAGR